VEGDEVTVTGGDTTATVVCANIEVADGIIHIIDAVLEPETDGAAQEGTEDTAGTEDDTAGTEGTDTDTEADAETDADADTGAETGTEDADVDDDTDEDATS
jgi:hypothetical protein